MNYQIWLLLVLLCVTVWASYNLARPFGWQSPLKVSHRYTKHLNGALYEILLIAWRRKHERHISTLMHEVSKANYAFAREIDMVTLLEEMHLPSGTSIYSKLPDGRILVIDAFHLRKDHVKRQTDFMSMGDYDVYAIVSQELIDTHEHFYSVSDIPKKSSTVA